MANIDETIEARAALKRLEIENERAGGFDEYPQFCEELLIEILPYLSADGLAIVKKMALETCRLDEHS